MTEITPKSIRVCVFGGSVVLCVALMAVLIPRYEASQHAAMYGSEQGGEQNELTADQQKMSRADRDLTQMIRKSLHQDRSLSHEAHNIRIFMLNGKVMLRGPVRSEEEKNDVGGKAADAVGIENVSNQLEVAAAK